MDKNKEMKMSMTAVKIIDAICIGLFVFMFIYILALPSAAQDLLLPVFKIINPYKTGAWIMGIGVLVTCIWGQKRTGLILGIVLLICYMFTAFASLAGLIVVTSEYELLWYLHPILIVISCIMAIRRKVCRNTRQSDH